MFDALTHSVIIDRYQFAGELVKDKRVIEVGPGAGFGIEYLSELASLYRAIEFSSQNVALLKSQDIGNAEIFLGDAHDIPYHDKSFDVVLALAMIYYLSFESFLDEVNRCLSDKGLLFFCTSNKDVPGFCAASGTTRYYSIPELHRLLTKHGFSAEFYGAFPCAEGNLLKRKVIAKLKNMLKALIQTTDIGHTLWRGVRRKSLGKHSPLPNKITKEHFSEIPRYLLDSSQCNHTFRVIYVIAQK